MIYSNIEQAISDTRKWIESDEGKDSLVKALRLAKETTEKLKSDRLVEEKMLREPFTI